MNDLDLCLEVNHCITFAIENVRDRGLVPKDHR